MAKIRCNFLTFLFFGITLFFLMDLFILRSECELRETDWRRLSEMAHTHTHTHSQRERESESERERERVSE